MLVRDRSDEVCVGGQGRSKPGDPSSPLEELYPELGDGTLLSTGCSEREKARCLKRRKVHP
jgi:hypothetical protein